MSSSFPPLDWVKDAPEMLRSTYAAERAELIRDIPVDVTIATVEKPGLSGLSFAPACKTGDTCILYFHGGGWIVGSPETHQTLCSFLAKETGLRVISPRYRLAPEHAFPAQRDDAVAALHAIDGPVILAGDSAGAAMALWVEAGVIDAKILGVVGLYGAFGLTDSPSIQRLAATTPGLKQPDIAAFYDHLGHPTPTDMIEDFMPSKIPLCLVQAGQDPLSGDTDHAAKWFEARGRSVTTITSKSSAHGFLHYVARDPEAQKIMSKVGAWISTLNP